MRLVQRAVVMTLCFLAMLSRAGSAQIAHLPRFLRTTPPPAAALYTAVQAERGGETYRAVCAACHAKSQHTGPAFAAAWNGRKVFDLYDILYNTMPQNEPGSLTAREYLDVVAYMLSMNGMPAGASPLPSDPAALKQVHIDVRRPGAP
jgi:mono/diheme cytochrome c family protein